MNNRRIIILLLLIGLIMSFMLLTSYALWHTNINQTGSNSISGSCLHIEFEEPDAKNIRLENTWPISDLEGININGYNFNIINTCKKAVSYQVILDSLELSYPANEMNTEYIKIMLDDGLIRRFKYLEDADLDNGSIASKKIYTGTIPAATNTKNGKVEHNLKLWMSEDASNSEESKEFHSKIRVIAGQNIVPDTMPTLQLVSNDGSAYENYGDVTRSNLHIGDKVVYGNQYFYVIGIDEHKISLLSRCLLNAGAYVREEDQLGLQSCQIGVTRDWYDSPYYYTNHQVSWDHAHMYGDITFSDTSYWFDNNMYISPYENYSFIYNKQSNLKEYVDGYVEKLKTMGLNTTSGTLLSIEKFADLCGFDYTNVDFQAMGASFYSNCPHYLFFNNYWLGSAYSCDDYVGCNASVLTANVGGTVNYHKYDTGSQFGIRPVIEIFLK